MLGPVEMVEEGVEGVAVGVAAGPLAHAVAVEGVAGLAGRGRHLPLAPPLPLLHQARVLS